MGQDRNTNFRKAGRRLGQVQELGVGSALIILALAIGFSTEHFFDLNNLLSIIRSSSFIGIMALGMVFVLSGRDVDLSVGGIYNLSGIFTAFLLMKEFPLSVAILGGLCRRYIMRTFQYRPESCFQYSHDHYHSWYDEYF